MARNFTKGQQCDRTGVSEPKETVATRFVALIDHLPYFHRAVMNLPVRSRLSSVAGNAYPPARRSESLASHPKRIAPKALTAALMAMVFPVGALASPNETESDLDGIEIEAQESEIEAELRIFDNHGDNDQQLQLQGEHALDDRWSIGAEVELERVAGEAVKADTALTRLKWRTPRNAGGFALAIQAGVGYSFGDKAALTETDVYLGWGQNGWAIVSRFDWDQLLHEGAEAEVGYRLRVARGVGSDITIGMEAAGDIWTGEPAAHRIGPYLELPLGDDDAPTLELGAFAGLNAASPAMVYRLELEFEF